MTFSEGLASACLSPNLVEVQTGLVAAVKTTNVSAAVRLRLIRELLDRHGMTHYPRAAVRAFLVRECRISEGTARKEIAAALATGPAGPLPLLGQALVAGEISREHVDVAVTMIAAIPARLITARGAEIDAVMVDWSRTWAPADVKTLAAQLSATLHPTDADKAADDAYECRSASIGVSSDGMVHLQAHLDPAAGALFKAVLEELAGPDHRPASAGESGRSDEGETGAVDRAGNCAPAGDEREREQRLADALGEMARLAQIGMGSEAPTAEPTRLVVVSTIEQLAHPDDDPHADHADHADAEHPHAEHPHAEHPHAEHPHAEHPGPAEQAPPPQQTDADPTQADQCEADQSEADQSEADQSEADQCEPAAEQQSPAAEAQGQAATSPQPSRPAQRELPLACAAPGLATALGVGPLAPTTLHRLACDSIVDHVLLDRAGAIAAMQTLGRFATPAQARALAARDGGCARPGCGAPPARCDVHHVTWWSRGGATRVDDMVLLCGPDHTLIHREDWQIVMEHGVPWFIPPPWIDPDQTPIRNTLHTALDAARRLGQHLRQDPHRPPLAA